MYAIRLGFSFLLGLAVAGALFVLMHTLIEMGDAKIDQEPSPKITDIFMPKTKIDTKYDVEKPEPPPEAQERPPEVQQQDIDINTPDAGLNISTAVGNFNPDIGLGGGFARDTDYIPVYVPQPRYPKRAERTGKAGYAVVEVIITTSGGVRDPKLLEEWPENYGFGRAALQAAEKLKYNPRVVDGTPVEVPGVLYKFTFAGFDK